MSAEQPRKLRRVVHPDRTRAAVLRGPVEKRRCSSCEKLGQALTLRHSRQHGPLWLCASCETTADERGWLE